MLAADKDLFKLSRMLLLRMYEVCGLEGSFDKSQALGLDEGMPRQLTVLGFVWRMTESGAVTIELPKESIEKAEKALMTIMEQRQTYHRNDVCLVTHVDIKSFVLFVQFRK